MFKRDKKTGLWLRNILRDERGFMPGLMPIVGPSGGGELPTTNLVAHFDFSNAGQTYKVITASTTPCYSDGPAADGDTIAALVSTFPAPTSEMVFGTPTPATTEEPTYKSGGSIVMPRATALFDGTSDKLRLLNRSFSTSGLVFTDLFGAGAMTSKAFIISFRLLAASNNDATNPYNNHGIMGDAAGYVGLYARNDGGTYKLQAFNFDGNSDFTERTISLNTNYVAVYRHDGTSVYLSVNGDAETSALSGTTSTALNQHPQLGRGYDGGGSFTNVHIGEMASYSSLTGQDLTDAINYFTARWL